MASREAYGSTRAWTVVVPVKRTELAKSRLEAPSAHDRAALALAFASDTVSAALDCSAVAEVVVVTDDPTARQRLSALGAVVVPDTPDAGLNAALRHGAEVARRRRPGSPVAALHSDLPALRPEVLERALRVAAAYSNAMVADANGTGTVLYTASPGARFAPRFGPHSSAAHQAAGVVALAAGGLEALQRDVDTRSDLRDACRLGVGSHTEAVLAQSDTPA